jgi:antirestriction protein ArdC
MATTSTSTTPRVDIDTRVTSRNAEPLEQGIRPWMRPWNHTAPRG